MKKLVIILALLGCLALGTAKAQTYPEGKDVWNLSVAPAANILTSSLNTLQGVSRTDNSCIFAVSMAIAPTASDSVVYFRVENTGDALPAINLPLNTGVPLVAGQAYSFEWNATSTFTYNFQVATATKIAFMTITRSVK